MLWGLLLLGTLWGSILGARLYHSGQAPTDAVLVLGGSIRREIYVAEQVAQGMTLPILISHGSKPPCIYLLFERAQASMAAVWLENCADSTLDNFRQSLPVLQRWGVRHVRVVTSATHLPRARWLAQILLGSHGIWVEMAIVPETGVPGNREYLWKTGLDVLRGLAWAIASQVYHPTCRDVMPLAAVDLADWRTQGFQCEYQGGIEDRP